MLVRKELAARPLLTGYNFLARCFSCTALYGKTTGSMILNFFSLTSTEVLAKSLYVSSIEKRKVENVEKVVLEGHCSKDMREG
jgi:hypothetical protein